MKRSTTSAALAALIFAVAASAHAAAPAKKAAAPAAPVATQATAPKPVAAPPAAALPPLNYGPTIPGICVYFDERAIGLSSVGKAASARLQVLRAQVSAELQAEASTIQTDFTGLQARRATMTPEQLQAAVQPIQQRQQALDQKANQRERELEATQQEALIQIHRQVDGIVRPIFQSHNCTILLNGDAVYSVRPDMDITDLVVTQLNVVLPTITFDRKILPPQGQPQQ